MSTEIVTAAVKENAKALQSSPALLDASEALTLLPDKLVIASDPEDASWGDVAKRMGKGAKHVESSLTELFRPMKAFEKMLREHFKTAYVDPLTRGVRKIDDASLAYRREKARKAEEERLAAERAAREAAEAAAREAEERRKAEEAAAAAGIELPPAEEEFDAAPGIAQTIAPVVEKVVRSEETTTYEVRKLECVMESEAEARKSWPEAFLFDEGACLEMFKANNPHGQNALDAGVMIGGVRFKNKIDIRRRDR